MKNKHITYGDLSEFLQVNGFERTVVPESHVVFHRGDSQASLMLPIERPSAHALPLHVAMTRSMLIDFGILEPSAVDRWIADPKHYQAA